MRDEIRYVLGEILDPANDDHWDTAGRPKVGVVDGLVEGGKVSRGDIEEVAPGFSRKNPVLPGQAQVAQASDPGDSPEDAEPQEPLHDAAEGETQEPEPDLEPEQPAAASESEGDEEARLVRELAEAEEAERKASERRLAIRQRLDDLRAQAAEEEVSPAEAYKRYVKRQSEIRRRKTEVQRQAMEHVGVRVPGVDASLAGAKVSKRLRHQTGAVGIRQRGMQVQK